MGLLHDLDCDQTRADLTKHSLVAAEMLRGRLSEDCAEAIRRHDYRTGLNPESSLDWALVAADTMARVIEKMPSGISSVEEIEAEIERIGVQRPWLKENLGKYRETGL